MTITIEEITGWEKDDELITGDRCHGGTSESGVLMQLANETHAKKESKWTTGLPFVYADNRTIGVDPVTDIAHEIRNLLDEALSSYSKQYCADDYLKPSDFEGRIEM